MNPESNPSVRVLAEQERLFWSGRMLDTVKTPEPVRFIPNRAQRRSAAKMQRRKQAKGA